MNERDYFTTFDLSYGYHNIEIHLEHWRGIGIKAIVYIDDGIILSGSFELAKKADKLDKNDLVSAKFVISVEKSDFNP